MSPKQIVTAAKSLPEYFTSEVKIALALPQRPYTVEKMDCGFLWHLFQLRSFGSEKEIRPLQSMQRSDAAYENRAASLQQIPRCQSGTTGKQQGEYHTPGQKLLVVFLKVKKKCTYMFLSANLCAQVPCSEIFRRVNWFQARALCLHNCCKIRSSKQNQPNTFNYYRTTEAPTTNHRLYCIGEKGRVLYN